ncbi:MAG: Rieske (2Fe-2S) protein [Ignavibacteria bacterium]|nr:Rieske (2Fe-2S) protein [Ignavibacteria bacterium]
MTDYQTFVDADGIEWLRICRSAEVHERHGKRIEIDVEFDLALFRVSGNVHCVSNVCPHKRMPVIYDGVIEHGIVTCPMHGWRYDVRTGQKDAGTSKLPCYQTREEDGWVYVNLQ